MDKKDRSALVFFILNTLNFIDNSDYYYCYCEKTTKKKASQNKIIVRSAKFPQYFMILRSLLTKIDSLWRSYSDIMTSFSTSLSNYLTNVLMLLIFFFFWVGGCEYYYSGRDWYSGECCRVSLLESIQYSDGIFLSQQRDKQKKKRIRTISSF